jgi:Holliday junction DNA helicase RuvA
VQAGDITALTRIPGIGKKTAERMVVELRDRAADLATAAASGRGVPAGDPQSEAITALQQLGYKPAEAAAWRATPPRRRRCRHHHPQGAAVGAALSR